MLLFFKISSLSTCYTEYKYEDLFEAELKSKKRCRVGWISLQLITAHNRSGLLKLVSRLDKHYSKDIYMTAFLNTKQDLQDLLVRFLTKVINK